MTGQILAGLDPLQAVKSQILLMLLLAGSSVLASGMTVVLALRLLTDHRQRLRLDLLSHVLTIRGDSYRLRERRCSGLLKATPAPASAEAT